MIPTLIPVGMMNVPVDVDTPRWDQSAFKGRYNHFVRIVNPLLSLKTTSDLSNARTLIEQARYSHVVVVVVVVVVVQMLLLIIDRDLYQLVQQ